jgi:ABC transport system ATP-binding/permease protein
LLEERLLDYDGTLLLVSHDRDFLDNVVTATIALDGQGGVTEHAGGCADWLDRMSSPKRTKARSQEPVPVPVEEPAKRKLLNKEREALKELPKKIEQMEAERDRITSSMQSPDYYRNPDNDPAGDQARLETLETKIAQDFERWEELEALV